MRYISYDFRYFRTAYYYTWGKSTGIYFVQVHAWMIDHNLGAGSVAKVTDNKDGSYKAEFIALWSGIPEIRVAIIAPREVIAIQFKRR